MALKYKLEYTDTVGSIFRAEISDVNWIGDVNDIQGTATLEYSAVESALEAVRGSVLTLNLEADATLDLTDLYSENETDISIVFYRNEVIMFIGFIKPDGIYTDFVNELYTISLDCVDGLGTLKDLSFVDENGYPFSGFMREIDIVRACLNRTSLRLKINVDIGIFHEGVTDDVEILRETKLSADRFYNDEEKDNIKDCEEVLKSVLEKYCAVICQQNGEWWIYRPIDLARTKQSSFFKYDYLGSTEGRADLTDNFIILGSQVDAFYPHHANGNQRMSINGSLSAFRVNYKYGFLKGFFKNPKLNGAKGDMDSWTAHPDAQFQTFNDNRRVYWESLDEMVAPYQLRHDPIAVSENDSIKLVIEHYSRGWHSGVLLSLTLTNGTDTVRYIQGPGWTSSAGYMIIDNYQMVFKECEPAAPDYVYKYGNIPYGDGQLKNKETEIDPIPFDGMLTVEIVSPYLTDAIANVLVPCVPTPLANYSYLKSLDIVTNTDDSGSKGEFHTAWRDPKSSSITEDVQTIYNGDMTSDIYEGVIKRLDDVNTEFWRHLGVTEARPILEIMVRDTILSRVRPQKVFVGDVYGCFDFINAININNIQGDFTILSYRYDTSKNIVSLELVETLHDIKASKIEYKKTIDYGNVIKPTIV